VKEEPDRIQAIAKFSYSVRESEYVDDVRIPEARAIAQLCASLIGNVQVRRSNGEIALAEPGDIALLAPTGTDLWLYERELEDKGLPVASQAGKNLYRRQEAQDFIALVRALADNRDTLALGAVLRGPLVGLTERELLDVTGALRQHEDGAVLSLRTDLTRIHHPVTLEVMTIVEELWRKRRGTTPHALLSDAIERLRVIPSIAARGKYQRDRSLGNLALLLARSRAYAVRGLKQLATDLASQWSLGVSFDEAPSDHTGDNIDIITVHKAKGLEWPIVIPINLVSMPRPIEEFFYNVDHGTVHWTFGEIAASTLAAVLAEDKAETANERERLLYVACTRALDLLILPSPSWWRADSWFNFFDLGQDGLQEIRLKMPVPSAEPPARSASAQTPQIFAQEADRIVGATRTIVWRRPSLHDVDRELLEQATVEAGATQDDPQSEAVIIGAGSLRGVILHKLMEELITGTVTADVAPLTTRAVTLIDQVAVEREAAPAPAELVTTALKTFRHKDLVSWIDKLVPEFPLYGSRSNTELVSARADAIAIENGKATIALDWKSDIAPSASDRKAYKGQLLQYLALVGVSQGAVVYMTGQEIDWITPGSCVGPT